MKKEKNFRKIVINSLLGFPVGITLLMINFVAVYFISGEGTFKNEITQLQDVTTLVLQLVITGFAYFLFFIVVNIVSQLNEAKYPLNKFVNIHPYITLLFMVFVMIINSLVIALLNIKVFSKNMSFFNVVTFMIIFVVCFIFICIKSIVDNSLVKKINQKLNEINQV